MEIGINDGSKVERVLRAVQRYRLALACVVIVLCFAIGNDIYAAKTVAQRHKDLLNGPRQAVDANSARRKLIEKNYRSDLTKRFLIDPRKTTQKSLLDTLSFQADICNQNTSFIVSLPFQDDGTTVGAADDYDLSGDPTNCASPTCEATSGNFTDRGYTYAGTGTGRDVAYKIAFLQPTSLKVKVTPTANTDLAVIFYAATCSSSPSDAIVMADNAGDGVPPDLPDNSETVTFTTLPAGVYNIVVDGYTYAGDPLAAGPYHIDVSCVPNLACATPGYVIPPRRNQ